MKRILVFFAALFVAVTVFGQTPLPLDPAVKVGKLDNGMTYYIRHNAQPAQRAEFYLATDVGAWQEADDQDGLAHFLEHMCFNGTKNFPDKALLDYLQSIGAEFGRNINASTGFEVTQYMLNNIPIVREGIIDSCLLVLHDYSHFVTCDPKEIDAERGVILEERRTRRDASWRMFEKSLPYIYGENTVMAKRTLIGAEEQLKTFKPESLVNFYRTWCRPDLQAVIVVGDVDVDQIEAKIKTIFSDIPAVENPTPKNDVSVPANAEPVVGIITDKEANSSSVDIYWRSEAMPKEMVNTDIGYMTDLIKSFIYRIMNERFNDIVSKPDAPFFAAGFGFQDLTNATEAAYGTVRFKDGNAGPAFQAFMLEIEKMKRYGFNDGEVARAKENILSYYEKQVEAASTRQNREFVRPLLNHFHGNESVLEPSMELQLVQAICAQINAPLLSQVAAGVITDENMTILYSGPEKEGLVNPTKEELLAIVEGVKTAEIEANVEVNTNEPLLDPAALKGSAVKKEKKTIYGATEWTLKNGVQVVVLPTDHKKDQVLFNLQMDGGKTLIPDEDMPSFEDNIWALYLTNTGVSKFPGTTLSKMLAGKIAYVSPNIGAINHGISGSCAPKDIETAFQLAYLQFTDPRFDEDEYQTGIQQIKAILPNISKDPSFIFQNEMTKILYGNDPRLIELNDETLAKANLATIEKNYRKLFKDAAGARVTIVGNVDLVTLKPLVEKYFGSLPKGKKAASYDASKSANIVKGESDNVVKVKMETPKSSVLHVFSAYGPVDVKKEAALDAATYALDMIYTKTIREEEGGTYGVSVYADARQEPSDRSIIQIYFDTNVESAERLSALAVKNLEEFAKTGPTPEQFNNAMENFKKNIPENRIQNSYWQSNLITYYRLGYDYDAEYEAAVNALTPEQVRDVIAEILAEKNDVEIILVPAE